MVTATFSVPTVSSPAEVPTISCSSRLVDQDTISNYNVENDDTWKRDATYVTSMCTFDADYSTVNCTASSGGDVVHELRVSCNVADLMFGTAVACSCNGMIRGFMDSSNCPSEYGCMSPDREDWTDNCSKWCYVERFCGQCFFDSATPALDYSFLSPWYENFVTDVQQVYQYMEQTGQETYLLEGLDQNAKADYRPVESTNILWNVVGQSCYEERLAEDGISMVQTPVEDEGCSHHRSNMGVLGIALVLSASVVVGAAVYLGYRSWEKRQYRNTVPDAHGSLL